MNSIHRSLLDLLNLGLAASESARPQTITRTLKFKVDTGRQPELMHELNAHFTAFESFRRSVLDSLEQWWNEDPDDFVAAMRCSTKRPYQGKTKPFGLLYTRFVKGQSLPPGLTKDAAFSIVDSLTGNMRSFLTRRETIAKEMRDRYTRNHTEWTDRLSQLAADLSEPPPDAPPEIDLDKLTVEAVGRFNDWVGRTRIWCNLVLIQRHKIHREDACLPQYLKGYPGFPGSQRYGTVTQLADAVAKLEAIALERSGEVQARFGAIAPETWFSILERLCPSSATDSDSPARARTARQTASRRLAALVRDHADWTPVQHAMELISGLLRGADKLKNHLKCVGNDDRRAVIKLANLYNVICNFSLEPLRVAGDTAAYYGADIARRNAFADVRGALHQPADDSAAIQITGFSVNATGSPNYNGLLISHKGEDQRSQWGFIYCHRPGQTFQIAEPSAKLRGKTLTQWVGYASRGGSKQKAKASRKELVRGPVWVSDKVPPTILPLAFGARQGRQYLWHFDRSLLAKNDWALGNGRLLRIMPPDRPDLAEFYLTITLERAAPPLATFAQDRFIGVDRGEAIPAAFAVIDSTGRLVTHGTIASEYRDQQRKFNERKRELQRTRGGYTRWLRAKERNRARALGGQVTRELLALAAVHKAPLVLENLGSALATRGGKGTIMSQMQYERMLSTLEQRLAEVGLYELAGSRTYRKRDNGFIKLVGPAYTSSTCSACGHVYDSEFYDKLADTLIATDDNKWRVTVNGAPRVLPTEYSYWLRGKGEQTVKTDKRLAELLKGRPVSGLNKTDRKTLVGLLRNRLLPFRLQQAEFQCVMCGHRINADIQGAINIARKYLFTREHSTKTGEMTESERKKVRRRWQNWYQEKLSAVW